MTCTRRLTWFVLILTALALPYGMAAAQQADAVDADAEAVEKPNYDHLLSTEWWMNEEYGISLRPPLKSRVLEMDADDALLRILGDGGYKVNLYVKSSKTDVSPIAARDLTLSRLQKSSMVKQILLQEDDMTVGGRTAASVYFRTTSGKSGARMVAQVFFSINPKTLAMLQFEVPDIHYRETAEIFTALLAELNVAAPEEMTRQREAEMDRGEAWLKSITPEAMEAAVQPEQYFLISNDKGVTGYVVIYQRMVEDKIARGVSVRLLALLETPTQDILSKSHFFIGADHKDEYWSTEVTLRSTGKPKTNINSPTANLPDKVWRESGERAEVDGKMLVRIKRDTPAGAQVIDGPMPPKAYLSQAEAYLLDRLLPHDVAATYGFIAYSGNTGKMTYRTETVKPTTTGSEIRSRATPGQPEQLSYYNKKGELLGRVLPNGHTIKPCSFNELKAAFPSRIKDLAAD